MFFNVNASQYKVEADDDYLNKPNHRLESFWFTIHNKDIDTFKYLWTVGCQFFNSSIIIKVLRRITENEWRDAMEVVMRSTGTKSILSNLSTKMLDKFFQEIKEPILISDYLAQREPEDYMKLFEDEIETLEQEMELISQEDNKCRAFYSQDLITASGTGNFDIIKDTFLRYIITQLGNINGWRDISNSILRLNSYVYKESGYVYKEERMNPMTLALIKNQTDVVQYYLETMPDLHLMYAWRRPSGSLISFIDYYNIRDEVFPLICAIWNKNIKLLDLLFTNYQNYFNHLHLRFILEEWCAQNDPEILSYIFAHPRTHALFLYLPYIDRMNLMGCLLKVEVFEANKLEEQKPYITLFYQRPYICPFMFFVMSNITYINYFNINVVETFSEEEVGEYIEEVTPSEVIFTVSNIVNNMDTSTVFGLEEFINKLETHPLYK